MPSCFPGIDPYLEAQDYWQDFHSRFNTYACDALNERLPKGYVAQLGEELKLAELPAREEKRVLPDVAILGGRRETARGSAAPRKQGAVPVLEPVTVPLPRSYKEIREAWIAVRRVRRRTPVTIIELLSPTNKSGDGYVEYKLKRRRSIRQKIHLVEFDFLLGGKRPPMARPLPAGDFYALVSRAERRPNCDVYDWTIRDPLPMIPIPLLPPDADVPLDLGALFRMAYDRGRYVELLDYSVPPSNVKDAAARAWAQRIAKAARR
jgi:hypothetical protein